MRNYLRPLRICLLSYRSNPHCGGQGVYIRNLARAMKDLGHSVEVIAGPPGPDIDSDIPYTPLFGLDLYNPKALFRTPSLTELADVVNFIEWAGVSTMGFPEPLTFGIRAFRFLRKKFDNYDIVHDNQCLSYGIAAISKRIPTIATIHHPITIDRDIAVKSVRSAFKKFKHLRWYSFIGMQQRVSRMFSNIITVSETSKQDISREFRIPLNKFRVVPNGIDTDIFYPIPEIEREKNRIIVTNSADMPLKGLYYLLHAVADIAKKRSVKLTVIGSPKENGGIERLIRELNLYSMITFTGRVDYQEFREHYAKAAVAVVPSVYEGFGLPVGEAMSCGVPVICTTGGALPEVAGDAAKLVPPADSAALSNAITELFDNPEYAAELGRAGYERVHREFTWRNAAEKTIEAYRETIRDYR